MGLKSNYILVGYSHKRCATIKLVNFAGKQVAVLDRRVCNWVGVCLGSVQSAYWYMTTVL